MIFQQLLPDGTELKAQHKGTAHTARVEGGKWVQAGKTYGSPSAAYAITESGINGWWFWAVKRPNDAAWTQLGKLHEG